MSAKHTPPPYLHSGRTIFALSDELGRWQTNRMSAYVQDAKTDPVELEATAAFIVRACNAHDALVAALNVVRMSAGWSIMSDETRGLVIAALAKGEGKP